MIQEQPGITVETPRTDHVLDVAGWVLLLVLIGLTVYSYSVLPETIPTHYNARGEPDDYGHKEALFVLPGIAVALFIGFIFLIRSSHNVRKMHHASDPDKALRQYMLATRMMRVVKLTVAAQFILVTLGTYLVAQGMYDSLSRGFILGIVGMIFVPVVYYAWRALRE
jgi:uncharacterized membrane protein